MALSGTFSKVYRGYTYKVTWSASQSISNNSSTITCTHKLTCDSGYGLKIGSRSNTCVINGTSKSFTSSSINTSGGTTITLGTTTHTINHSSDGTGSFSLKATFNIQATISGTYVGSIVAEGSGTLDTIPRKSSISFGEFTMNKAGTITINKASTSFSHTITYKFGSKSGTIAEKTTGTSVSWTPPLSTLANQIPNTTQGQGTLTITTYSGTTSLGSNSYTFYCNLGNVSPTMGTITLTPQTYSYLIQNKNTVKVSVSGCSAGIGSTIKSYTFSGPGITATTTTNTSVTSKIISSSGTMTYTVTVTDSRGCSASKTATITCYAYSPPCFKTFKAYRVNANEESDSNGTLIKCDYTMEFSSVNNTNNISVKLMYKSATDDSYYTWTRLANSTVVKDAVLFGLDNPISLDENHIVYAEITDAYGGKSSTDKITIFSASRVLNIRASGDGIAFGKMADFDNLLESKWPAKFDNGLTVGDSTQTSAPTGGIHIHDVRDAEITPESFGYKNANFYFDQVDGRFASVLHMMGWESNTHGKYAAWELAGNASTNSYDDTLRYRQGVGNTWSDWQTVLTNKNIGSHALPLTGGTLTGKLTLKGSQYYGQDAAGIDCQNSDITNINGLYFSDAADTSGEGINLYNSTGKWDTIYTSGGDLRYQPGRTTDSAPSGYKVFHSGNLMFRSGKCTLSSANATTINFSSAMSNTPIIMLTPLTTASGVITAKVTGVTTSGFSAIIGGSSVSSAQFAYLAIYY